MTIRGRVPPEYLEKLSTSIRDEIEEDIPMEEISSRHQADSIIRQLNALSKTAKENIAGSLEITRDELEVQIQSTKSWVEERVSELGN